mgnify:CR=1 FL=1
MKDYNYKGKEDFTFFDFENKRAGRNTIPENGFQIYILNSAKSNNYAISMGKRASTSIIQKGLNKMRIRVDNITGQIHLVFNKSIGKNLYKPTKGSKICRVGGVDVVKCIVEHFGGAISRQETALKYMGDCSNDLSNSDEYATFELTNLHKYEE